MTKDKIPVELASMVGDYESITAIKKVPSIDGKEHNEYWLFGTKMWKGAIDYLTDHNYKIVGADKYSKEENSQVRLWVKKIENNEL